MRECFATLSQAETAILRVLVGESRIDVSNR
jgi:hypothetical protein